MRAARRSSSASRSAPSSAPTASSVAYRADRGHHQQDAAGGGARFRPGADQLAIETGDRPGRRSARPRPLEVRRRNFIRHDEFPYLIPSGTTYDSGDYHTVIDKALEHTD